MTHEEIMVKITGKRDEITAVEESLNNICSNLHSIGDCAHYIMNNGYMDIEQYDKLLADIRLCSDAVYGLSKACKPLIRWLMPRAKTSLLSGPKPLTDADIDAYNAAVRIANLDGCDDILGAVRAALKAEKLIAE